MQSMKKGLAGIVVVLLSVTLAAGCAGGEEAPSSVSAGKTVSSALTTQAQGDETTGTAASNGPTKQGTTVSRNSNRTQAASTGKQTPATNKTGGSGASAAFLNSLKGTKVQIMTQMTEKRERGTASGDRYYSILKKVGQKYGATIETVEVGGDVLLNSILSGSPMANIMSVEHVGNWLNAGAVASLDNAMKEAGVTFKEAWYNQDIRKFMNFSDKQYGWISDIVAPFFVFYNKRLVSAAQLEDPYAVYARGEWDFETLKTYAKAMTKKAADGSVVTRGLGTLNSTQAMRMFVYQNGGDVVSFQGNKLRYALTTNKAINGLKFFQELFNEGYIGSGGDNWRQPAIDFAQGKTGMIIITKYITSVMTDNNMVDAVGLVPIPYGPDAKKDTNIYYDQAFVTMIPKPCEKDAGKLLFLMNEVNKEMYANRDKDFQDDFRLIIRDNAAYELFKVSSLNPAKAKFKYDHLATVTDPLNSLSVSLIRDNHTPAQAASASETAFNNALKTNWGNVTFTGK